jgi:hypothetical protein
MVFYPINNSDAHGILLLLFERLIHIDGYLAPAPDTYHLYLNPPHMDLKKETYEDSLVCRNLGHSIGLGCDIPVAQSPSRVDRLFHLETSNPFLYTTSLQVGRDHMAVGHDSFRVDVSYSAIDAIAKCHEFIQ